MLKVAAFTGGVYDPSARFRIRQHVPSLLQHGISIIEMKSTFGKYPPSIKWMRPFWGGGRLIELIPQLMKSHRYDVVILQREMLSTFVTFEQLTKAPRVLDVDDAIFLHRGGNAARHLARISDRVICGNSYLAERFSSWNKNVVIIPTAVDTNRYIPLINHYSHENQLVIGWIGTSGNLKFIYNIEAALAKVLAVCSNAKLRIVCNIKPKFNLIDNSRCEFIKWEEELEINNIQTMAIGIMPLEDTDWSRGKCSFKMLQYMSCGLPVVVSPIGMNSEVLSMGDIGYGVYSQDEWVEALTFLLGESTVRREKGMVGRRIVEESFSIHRIAPLLASSLSGV